MATVAAEVETAVADAVAEDAKDGRGRTPAYDWAKETDAKKDSLSADKLDAFWACCDEKKSVAMLKEELFTNELEYHRFRKEWFERRKTTLLKQFEEKNKGLNDKISEETTFVATYEKYDDIETAREVATMLELKRKLDAQMEALSEAGHDVNDILAD